MLAIALLPLWWLRSVEHHLGAAAPVAPAAED
jgi:hypothetical protein